jgi:hypothetical protein
MCASWAIARLRLPAGTAWVYKNQARASPTKRAPYFGLKGEETAEIPKL